MALFGAPVALEVEECWRLIEECWRLSSTAPELCEIAVAHAVVVAVVLQ
jgi:hypothetical protein